MLSQNTVMRNVSSMKSQLKGSVSFTDPPHQQGLL